MKLVVGLTVRVSSAARRRCGKPLPAGLRLGPASAAEPPQSTLCSGPKQPACSAEGALARDLGREASRICIVADTGAAGLRVKRAPRWLELGQNRPYVGYGAYGAGEWDAG